MCVSCTSACVSHALQVRGDLEEANRAREEEEDLINLLRQEEAEAKRQADEEEAKRRQEQMKREIQLANEYQMRLKVWL